MSEANAYPPVGPCVVQSVLLVDLYERPQRGYRFVASSLPGHLIQVVISGRTHHEANGRQYDLSPRDLIWYHEDELVRGVVRRSPWRFYTCNFIAPALSPPPFEQRVRKVDAAMMSRFANLLAHWRDTSIAAAVRETKLIVGAVASRLTVTLCIEAPPPLVAEQVKVTPLVSKVTVCVPQPL